MPPVSMRSLRSRCNASVVVACVLRAPASVCPRVRAVRALFLRSRRPAHRRTPPPASAPSLSTHPRPTPAAPLSASAQRTDEMSAGWRTFDALSVER